MERKRSPRARFWPLHQIDGEIYIERHRIDNVFRRLGETKHVANRFDKANNGSNAMVHLAAAHIQQRCTERP